jgi:hypothetical protein
MLDIHPPHHPTHGWRDFFVHIATIVVGLLIAIGLEQTVEYIHHRHEAEHAREMLEREIESNDQAQQREQYVLAMHEDYLFNDLAVLSRLRRHALLPEDKISLFHPNAPFANSAWQTVQQSGALAFLPYDEIQRYSDLYSTQAELDKTLDGSGTELQIANTMFYQTVADRFDPQKAAPIPSFFGMEGDAKAHAAFEKGSPGHAQLVRLTPAQIDRMEPIIQESIYQDEKAINRCKWLHERSRPFHR